MAIQYSSYDCPICSKSLKEGEIVVCPECGAPYHRDCYLKEGHCIFPDLHQSGGEWTPPVKEEPQAEAERFDGMASLRCPRCGTVNPPYGLFCQVCGTELNKKAEDIQPEKGFNTYQQPPFMGANIPLNPYTTPFGGVAPDEEIDGVPAKELAIFVGRNSHYYLPKFKALASTKAKTVNWASFFFTGGHFIYRKMYWQGILIELINLVLSLPYLYMLYLTMSTTPEFTSTVDTTNLTNINFICNLLVLALRLLCGFFGNTLYKSHVYSKIKKIKEKGLPEEEYLQTLVKKGSVAIKLMTGLLIGYAAVNIIAMYLVIMFGA